MTPFRTLVLLFLVAFALTCITGPALADDKAAGDEPARGAKKDHDYVADLTKEELAAVKQMIAKKDMSWDALEPHTRNRIAAAVVRMRNMSLEDRERLRGKLERIRGEEQGRHARMGRELDRMRGDAMRRDKGAQVIRISQAIAEQMLDKEQRDRIRKMGLPWRQIQVVVFERFKEHIGAAAMTDEELSALPEPIRRHLQKSRAKRDAEQDPKKKGRYETMYRRKVGQKRVEVFVRGLGRPKDKGAPGAYAKTISQKLRENWPDAFEAAVNDLSAALDDPKAIQKILQASQPRGQKQAQLFSALLKLEPTLPLLMSDSSLHRKAETLRDGILMRGFGVPRDKIAQFPVLLPRQDWRVHRVQVFQFLQKHGKLDKEFVTQMRRGLQRGNGERKMRDRPRRAGPGGGGRPGGVPPGGKPREDKRK